MAGSGGRRNTLNSRGCGDRVVFGGLCSVWAGPFLTASNDRVILPRRTWAARRIRLRPISFGSFAEEAATPVRRCRSSHGRDSVRRHWWRSNDHDRCRGGCACGRAGHRDGPTTSTTLSALRIRRSCRQFGATRRVSAEALATPAGDLSPYLRRGSRSRCVQRRTTTTINWP